MDVFFFVVFLVQYNNQEINKFMDNSFYLLGVLYFAVSIYNFLSHDCNKCLNLSSDESDLKDEFKKKEEGAFKKYYPRQMVGVLFFVWTCIGSFGGFPEEKFFMLNLIVSVSYFIVLCIVLIYMVITTSNETKDTYGLKKGDETCQKPFKLTEIVYFSEIILIGTILTIHYFIL
jgi:hypothetical protein